MDSSGFKAAEILIMLHILIDKPNTFLLEQNDFNVMCCISNI